MSDYLAVMEAVKLALLPLITCHVKELMAKAKFYGGEPVHAFHAVWLQRHENIWIKWSDKEAKLQYCHVVTRHHLGKGQEGSN